jgi:hypothetical protein
MAEFIQHTAGRNVGASLAVGQCLLPLHTHRQRLEQRQRGQGAEQDAAVQHVLQRTCAKAGSKDTSQQDTTQQDTTQQGHSTGRQG